jgi:hypothetical protein
MKLKLIKITLIIFSILSNLFLKSQEIVKVIATGYDYNQQKALSNALRNSLEKASGVYISSQTIVEDDKLIFDEVSSISNGTIVKYNIINNLQNTNSKEYNVTVEAYIEVGKIISLIKEKGINVEFNGSSFAQNIKLNEFYKNEELKILKSFFNENYYKNEFKLINKRILSSNPVIYKKQNSNFSFTFPTGWNSHNNHNILEELKENEDTLFKIGNFNYCSPFTIKYYNSKRNISFNGVDYVAKHDSILNVVNQLESILNNKTNWNDEEMKAYSNYNFNSAFDWYDFKEKKIGDSIKKYIQVINNDLNNKRNYYVFNLVPIITVNENYNIFINAFESLLSKVSLNSDSSFSEKLYKEQYGDIFKIILYKTENKKLIKKNYFLRNIYSVLEYNKVITNLMRNVNGQFLNYYNVLQTNIGPFEEYLMGNIIDKKSNNKILSQLIVGDDVGLIINPLDSAKVIGYHNSIYESPKFYFSYFAELDKIEKINSFTIDNDPFYRFLPLRSSNYCVDNSQFLNSKDRESINNIITENYKNTGVESFVIIDNNNYGYDDTKDLADEYVYEWKIGGNDLKGFALVINPKSRDVSVYYGRGLASYLNTTDTEKCLKILTEHLKNNQKFKGIESSLNFLYNVIKK